MWNKSTRTLGLFLLAFLAPALAPALEMKDLEGSWKTVITDDAQPGAAMNFRLDIWPEGKSWEGYMIMGSFIRPIRALQLTGSKLIFKTANQDKADSIGSAEITGKADARKMTLMLDESATGAPPMEKPLTLTHESLSSGAALSEKQVSGTYEGEVKSVIAATADTPKMVPVVISLKIEGDDVGGSFKVEGKEFKFTEVRRIKNRFFMEWTNEKGFAQRIAADAVAGGLQADISALPAAWGAAKLTKKGGDQTRKSG